MLKVTRPCKNTQVDAFTNSLGFEGFKVTRTKTVTGEITELPAGVYQDVVYVYILPEIIEGPGVNNYAGVMFAVDIPSPKNLTELEVIADSFFTL